jgi:hypothetical protein
MSEMLKNTVEGTADPFNEGPNAFLFVLLTVLLAVAQISFINQGLALFDGTLFVPLYTAALIVCGVTFGSVYYQELECFSAAQWALFPLGIAVTVTASVWLSAAGAARLSGGVADVGASCVIGGVAPAQACAPPTPTPGEGGGGAGAGAEGYPATPGGGGSAGQAVRDSPPNHQVRRVELPAVLPAAQRAKGTGADVGAPGVSGKGGKVAPAPVPVSLPGGAAPAGSDPPFDSEAPA